MRWGAGAAATLACAAFATLLAGCGERTPLGPGRSGYAGTGVSGTASPSRDPALLGSWRRLLLLIDDDGTQHASETVWTFAANGTATRQVTATNLTEGFFDTVTATAAWHTEGLVLVLDFRAPDGGTVRFAYDVRGTVLVLGDREFLRA